MARARTKDFYCEAGRWLQCKLYFVALSYDVVNPGVSTSVQLHVPEVQQPSTHRRTSYVGWEPDMRQACLVTFVLGDGAQRWKRLYLSDLCWWCRHPLVFLWVLLNHERTERMAWQTVFKLVVQPRAETRISIHLLGRSTCLVLV